MRKISPEKEKAILSAAEELVLQGSNSPTNEQVREFMGGGSIADISPTMRKWRDERKNQYEAQLVMPDSVKTYGEQLISRMWQAAEKEVMKRLHDEVADYQEKLSSTEAERDELLAEVRRLEDEKVTLLADFTEKSERMVSLAQEQKEKMEALEKENHSIKLSQEREVSDLKLKLEAAKSQADSAKALIGDYKERLDNAQESNKELQAQLIEIAKNKRAE